jgi:hypothetical protein
MTRRRHEMKTRESSMLVKWKNLLQERAGNCAKILGQQLKVVVLW